MKFDAVNAIIGGYPQMSSECGKMLYDHIVDNRATSILELGFDHGKSSIYMAAALDELGAGRVLAIDLEFASTRSPNIEKLGEMTGLSRYVEPVFSKMGSHWELRKLILEATADGRCEPRFDLCFIDAFHSWEQAGLEFFLVEKLLKPGGVVVFDDVTWSFHRSPSWRANESAQKWPMDYRTAEQVGDVWRLLVKQHPSFEPMLEDRTWAWARKADRQTPRAASRPRKPRA